MTKRSLAAAGLAWILVAGVIAWLALGRGCAADPDLPDAPRTAGEARQTRAVPAVREVPPTTVSDVRQPTPEPRPSAPATRDALPPEPAVAEGVVVEGHVVDTGGAPIAGATVTATVFRPLAQRGTAPASRGTATTGADGAFRTRLPKDTVLADVAASASGFASACVERVRIATPVEIRLAREGVISGRVLDPAGRPIGGASVRLFRLLGHDHIEGASATTSADGEFRIGGFGTKPWWFAFHEPRAVVLDVRADGFGASQDFGPFPAAGTACRRDVVLHPSRPLTVDVADADSGGPIALARVTLGFHASGLEVAVAGEERSAVPHPAPYVAEGVTDERGVCVLADAPARLAPFQQLIVRAWKQGFTAEVVVMSARSQVDDERVAARLWASATIKGRVVDATGAPVPGATVTADGLDKLWDTWFSAPFGDRPWGGTFATTGVTTGDDGCYVLPSVRAGSTVPAYVWTLGRREPLPDGKIFPLPNWAGGGRPPGVEVRIRPGEEATAPDIVVAAPRPSAAARFVVVDEQGRAVADARLENSHACGSPAWTDADGRATLRWVAEPDGSVRAEEGTPAVIIARAGLVNAIVRCRPDVAAPPEVRVVLVRGTRIEGRVREADGSPVVGWTVYAYGNRDGEQTTFGGAQTGTDGTFTIDGVPADPVDLAVSHVGSSTDVDRRVQVKGALAGGAPVDLVLPTDKAKYGTLVVISVDAHDGSPVVESYVYARRDAGAVNPSPGSPRVATFDRVPVGTWTVTATAKGWLPAAATATVTEGQTTRVRIALVPGTPAVVQLMSPVPLRRGSDPAYVYAVRVDAAPGEEGAGDQVAAGVVDPVTAVARFDALRPGRYRLWCYVGSSERDDYYVASASFEVGPPGKATARPTLDLVAAGSVAVVVKDAEVPKGRSEGAASSKAAIEVIAAGGERHRVVTGVTSYGAEVRVSPGDYIVRLLLPSGRVREARATVRAGESAVVRFDAQ